MRFSLLVAISTLCIVNLAAHADPVTFAMTGTFTGILGAVTFTDNPGTFTFVGDTSGTMSLGAGFYTNTDGLSTLTLAGIGTAVFLSSSFGAESETDTAGFYDINTEFGVSIYDPTLGAYALTAPFSDTGYLENSFAASLGTTESTSLGDLSITGDDGTLATFTATPEPSTWAMLLDGAGLLAVTRYRRRTRSISIARPRRQATPWTRCPQG